MFSWFSVMLLCDDSFYEMYYTNTFHLTWEFDVGQTAMDR